MFMKFERTTLLIREQILCIRSDNPHCLSKYNGGREMRTIAIARKYEIKHDSGRLIYDKIKF